MQDQLIPQSAWRFNSDVTAVFEDMLQRSIPQYEVMRQAVADLTRHYLSGTVVDLGCSRGEALASVYQDDSQYIGVEVSPPMLSAARERFAGCENVDIRALDLRTDYPPEQATVTLSILTLQFTPIEYRLRILRSIFEHTQVFILVEKVLGASADLDALMVERYYALKGANGYSPEQIERKRLSLEGVLVPVTAKWNEELLHNAGFKEVDCFWRWMNFAGWIATA